MRFRPCIDIHNGIVKQIVGSSLKDENDQASENYVANRDASWFAKRYKQDGLAGRTCDSFESTVLPVL